MSNKEDNLMINYTQTITQSNLAKEMLQMIEKECQLVPEEIREWWTVYLKGQGNRYLDIISFLDDPEINPHILEIGSVPGHLTIMLKKMGYNIQGVDIDPTRLKKLWKKYNVNIEKIDVENQKLPFKSDSFNIILFTEILEHMRLNPLYALNESFRVLKPGGKLILSTPNITPISRIRFLMGKPYQGNPVEEFKKLDWLGHMGHIRLYSYEEVCSFLESSGFTILFTQYKGDYVKKLKFRILMLLWRNREIFRPYLYVLASKKND